jgi:hypothetical protein
VTAAGIAATLSILSFLQPAIERTLLVPVEFKNLPSGMEVAEMSHETLQVEMHGRPWIMDSIDVSHLVAAVDLSGGRPGRQVIRIRPEIQSLPPGVNIDRVLPSALAVPIETVGRSASPL